MAKGRWQVFTGFRHQVSDRHFIGRVEQKQRELEKSQFINWVNMFDFAATYQVSNRLSLTLSVPLVLAERSTAIRDAQRRVIGRTVTQSNGIGDMSIAARMWVFNTENNPDQNLTVGVSLKMPTGDYKKTDTFNLANGVQEVRPVDVSIQPGDGGWGFAVETQGFKRVWKTTLSMTGLYLFNPRNTVSVPNVRSVGDQYLLRFGAGFPILPEKGFAGTFAWRIEGMPSTDLIGKSDGMRRPGYSASLEPGLVWGIGSNVFTISAPIAVSRNRTKVNGNPGDAAFADSVILAGWAHRF